MAVPARSIVSEAGGTAGPIYPQEERPRHCADAYDRRTAKKRRENISTLLLIGRVWARACMRDRSTTVKQERGSVTVRDRELKTR